MHRNVAQVTRLCLQQPYKEREVMLLDVCFENVSLKGACDFPAAMCCSHTVFKRRNVIFRCHILISKIQTKFLTITPTFIQRANRVHNVFAVVYLSRTHFIEANVCNSWTYFLNLLIENRKNKSM